MRATILRTTILSSILTAAMLHAPFVQAATPNWLNTGSTSWTTGSNWSTGTVPLAADTVTINQGASGPNIVAPGATASIVNVGTNATGGTLTISSGGVLTDGTTYIAVNASSVGAVSVTGNGSVWNDTVNLSVGTHGTGTLSIQSGGTVNSAGTAIGDGPDSTGTATIVGSGSVWSNGTGSVYVGNNGNGTLNIQSGGIVSDGKGVIGNVAGSYGTATITGNGSVWDNGSGQVVIGNSGTGTLNVQNGGIVTSSMGIIGHVLSGPGMATVTGSGSIWSNGTGSLSVGFGSAGSLTISNGGSVIDGVGNLGNGATGNGTAIITGSGSLWTNTADLAIGVNGYGSLTIANGAQVTTASGASYTLGTTPMVSSSTVYIANLAGSTGTLNIGAPSGSAPTAPGTLVANTVAFGAGTGTIVFNHTSSNYAFTPAITGNGTIDLVAGNTFLAGNMSDFTGTINVSPGVNYTTLAQQQAATQDLASRTQASMIDSRATADELLGANRPMDDSTYAYAGAMFGSADGFMGGQYSAEGVTFLGGIAYGAQDYPGIQASDAPTVAAALRYTFADLFGGQAKDLHPFAELGGWVTPQQTLTPTRTYNNGIGASLGQGNTNATSWDEYGRLGAIWNADKADTWTGYGEFGQQSLRFNGYAENSSNNPFPASVQGGVARYYVAKLGGSYTRDLKDLIYAPWTVTLSGAAAHTIDPQSDLNVDVSGVNMTASNAATTWGEFGARIDAHITDRTTAALGILGTTGAGTLGTSVHGTVGIAYSF